MGERPTALLGSLQPWQKVPGENTSSLGEPLHGVILLLSVPLHRGFGRRQSLSWTQLSQLEEPGPPRVLYTPFSEGNTQNVCFPGPCEQAALLVVTAMLFVCVLAE